MHEQPWAHACRRSQSPELEVRSKCRSGSTPDTAASSEETKTAMFRALQVESNHMAKSFGGAISRSIDGLAIDGFLHTHEVSLAHCSGQSREEWQSRP